MGSTLAVDLWVDLPKRQHMRAQNIAARLGAEMGANTVALLEDGTPMNFVFVNGPGSFEKEFKPATRLEFCGKVMPVLKRERILKSKEAIRRDKDIPPIVHSRNLLRCRRSVRAKQKPIPRKRAKL